MSSTTNLDQLRQIQDELRTADGDREVSDRAFLNLFELYDDVLRRYALRQSVPAGQIDDLVQEVWLEIHKRLPDFRHNGQRGAFRAWLFQFVRGKAVDEVRKRNRHSPGLQQSTSFFDKRADSETEGDQAEFERELVRQAVQKFFDSAPPREREVFELYYSRFNETAPPTDEQAVAFHQESAERFGTQPNASRAALKRAKDRVREIIDRLLGNDRSP